jgi:RNA polymerase sigma-70 factor, ECF subfamily
VSPADLDRADVALAVTGGHAAFERLYRRHVPRVTSLAGWLLDAGDIDDAVQEVFIRVWQKLHTFAGQASFGTWLHRVAVNLMLRARQGHGRLRRRQLDDPSALDQLSAPLERPDLRVALERAVETLPDGARQVFVLHDMEGYKHEEIAELLEVDPGTSRSQLHRARLLLRRQLAS